MLRQLIIKPKQVKKQLRKNNIRKNRGWCALLNMCISLIFVMVKLGHLLRGESGSKKLRFAARYLVVEH